MELYSIYKLVDEDGVLIRNISKIINAGATLPVKGETIYFPDEEGEGDRADTHWIVYDIIHQYSDRMISKEWVHFYEQTIYIKPKE